MMTPRVAGVILAGGRGKRLGGVIKANLKVGGTRLVDRIADAVQLQADPVLLSIGKFAPDTIQPHVSLCAISDADGPDIGPVAGLAAAVAWCQAHDAGVEFLLSAAVDTPFFPSDFVARALPLMDDNAGVVMGAQAVTGAQNEQIFPTNALWRLSHLSDLADKIAAGNASRGLKAVLDKTQTRILTYAPQAVGGCFSNINTIEDVINYGHQIRDDSGLGKADQNR